MPWCYCYDEDTCLKLNPLRIFMFRKPNKWTLWILTIFYDKTEMAGTMTKTLLCGVRVLLRNIISHLVSFSVSSPNPDGASGGVEHGSTLMWVDVRLGCPCHRSDDHHGGSHLLLPRSHVWRSGVWRSTCPGRCSCSIPWTAIGSIGFFAWTTAGCWDGAYVPKTTYSRAPAPSGNALDRAERHDLLWDHRCLSALPWISSRGCPDLRGGYFRGAVFCNQLCPSSDRAELLRLQHRGTQ